MDRRKKRKIESGAAPVSAGTRAKTAFELRSELLNAQPSARIPQATGPKSNGKATSDAAAGRSDEVKSVSAMGVDRKGPGPGAVLPNVEDAPETPQSPEPSRSASRASPEPSETVPAPRVVQLSSFKPSKQNFQRKAGGISVLKLPEGERVVLLGSYGLKIRTGEVTIAGASLRAGGDVSWVHSPHCHALPVLRCPHDATIELHPHPASASLRSLRRLSPRFDRLWNEDPADTPRAEWKDPARDTFKILYTTEDGPKAASLQELVSPAEWNKTLASLTKTSKQAEPLTILVCGPKSSGKSTFSRLLANRFMTDGTKRKPKAWPGVAFLDIDPGQPEFGPPGALSLVYTETPNLEPPFCHPFVACQGRSKTLRSHSVAAISPMTNPDHYMECVLDLYGAHNAQLRGKCPLVINTCGWVQGTGLNILTELITKVRPTEVVYMSKDGPEDTIEGLREACGKLPFTTLPSQSSKYMARTAQDFRAMQMMSYFHMDLSAPQKGYLEWNSNPLTSIPPCIVKYGGPNPGICGIICYDYEPSPDMLGPLIDGMILAVIEVEDTAAFRGLVQSSSHQRNNEEMDVDRTAEVDKLSDEAGPVRITPTPEGLPLISNPRGETLDPRFSQAIGLALVRGIDTQSQTLQLLTPIPSERIAEIETSGRRLVLAWGKLDAAPTWSYVEDRHKQECESRARPAEQETEGEEEATSHGGDVEDEPDPSATETSLPWVEELRGNQKRSTGSKVLRVRRDLGRGAKSTA